LIVMVFDWPGLFTTSIPLLAMVNVWGEVGETFEIVNRSPVWVVTARGVKKKSDCVTFPRPGGGGGGGVVWLGVGLGVWVGDGLGLGVGDGLGEGDGLGDGLGEGDGDGEGDGEGLGLGDGLGDGEGDGLGDCEGEGDGLGDGDGEGVGEGLGEGLGEGELLTTRVPFMPRDSWKVQTNGYVPGERLMVMLWV
jgi:hypothetical protein